MAKDHFHNLNGHQHVTYLQAHANLLNEWFAISHTVYMYITYIYIYIYICITYITYMYIRMYVCMYAGMHACMHTCIHVGEIGKGWRNFHLNNFLLKVTEIGYIHLI